MSFAAYKMMHWPTGIQNCVSGFITQSPTDLPPQIASVQSDFIELDCIPHPATGPLPNLILTSGNVLEIFILRVQHQVAADLRQPPDSTAGGRCMAGVSSVLLELVCHYKLHGNVESMAVLPATAVDGGRRRDSIVLTFRDAKISVLEFDDSVHGLRSSSMHCFEGPDWCNLKRGKECFHRGPMARVDPQGRCVGVLIFDLQMVIFKGITVHPGSFGENDGFSSAPVPARVDSSYIFNLRDFNMKHMSDFVFVHGYTEPVIVILQKRDLTWAGLTSCKHHTSILSAISINTNLKQQSIIWSASNLPHDAYMLLAVPPPIRGVLVICTNSIHYHTQSMSCTLQLNSFASSDNNDIHRSTFPVELDAANATWLLNDVAMFSTKTGELLLLTVVYDGRMVQRLELSKSKGSVLTSGITTLGNSLFFLGSRLGDSLLVQFSCGAMASASHSISKDNPGGDIDGETHSAKRSRRSSSEAVQGIGGVEELSLYSSSLNDSESAHRSFCFAVRDSLVNIGPIKDFTYSLRANADMNATGISRKSNYELVCCSGHGKNGALCIMQQSIRPEMITEVELPGCRGIWTVYYNNSRGQSSFNSSKIPLDQEEYHAYLIISMDTRTMVLETAEDLREITENVDYYVQGRTISAGNLFRRKRVVQIFSNGARILDGSFLTQELSFGVLSSDSGSKTYNFSASTASIADPYVLIKMTDGSVCLLVGDLATCTISITTPSVFDASKKPISSCTLYHDKGPGPWLRKTGTDAWLGGPVDRSEGSTNEYGDVYCIVCYKNGTLEIFNVPDFHSVFSVCKFPYGKNILFDNQEQIGSHLSSHSNVEEVSNQGKRENADAMGVSELVMHKWEGAHSRPFLFAVLTDGTVLCYHAYLFDDPENQPFTNDTLKQSTSVSRLRNLRFVRVSIENYSREESSSSPSSTHRITVLTNVGGVQGIFLSGSRPAWVMVFRERLRVHPQLCDGSIAAFTILHNINCSHGFIYVTSKGFLKICQLPSGLFYDNCWPVRKVPLKGTPHQITYISEKNLYPIIVSFPVRKPANQVLSLLDHDGQIAEGENYTDDFHQMYTVEEFQVRIFEPEISVGPWKERETIPMNSLENALTVRVVSLLNTTTKENQILLAIGTAYVQGEEVSSRGRVLLYSTETNTNTDNPQNVVTHVYSKELKGAISALVAIQGHLLIAAGPKVILHTWSGTELNGVAFFDAPPLYVVSLNIVKNFILIGDVHKSIYFLSRKEHGSQLTLLAKDFGSLDCLSTEFLIDGSTLSLVASDEQKNIQIFYYAPKMSESWKGQKLLLRAEFHVGAHVTKFLRLQMLSSSPDRSPGSEKTNKFALLFGTLDGGVGCIAPIDELTFRRLQSLQKKLVNAVQHMAGLNPKSFRQFWTNGKPHRPGPDSVVDCELLSHYDMMPLDEQLEIAQQIGTTRSQIVSNLSDLAVGTSFL